jgi:hypothetical protein
MDEDFTTETKLDLLGIELEAIAQEIQAIEDGLIAIQKKYGRGNDEAFSIQSE